MLRKLFKRKKARPTLPFKKAFNWNGGALRFNRIALVNLLCASKSNGNYLEIGCQNNILFDAIPVLNKIGLDPVSGGTHKIYSDEFFRGNSECFDVVFIDGLHIYDQVRRDVMNAIRFLKPGGWIALHDMLPNDAISEHVPNISPGPWCGDVWKVAFGLASSPGIEFKIIKIDSGIGVIRLDKGEVELSDLRHVLHDKRFQYLYENITQLPLVEWEEGYRWIRLCSEAKATGLKLS